jgi:hypothetical protein
MVGNVLKGRLFAALLVVAGVLFPDMARAETGQLSDSLVNTHAEIIPYYLAAEITRASFVLMIIFSVKIATAIIGRYQQNQPVRIRRFGVIFISAACCMIVNLLIHYTQLYYRTFDADFLISSLSAFLVLLFFGWLYVYKPRLKSWRFVTVGFVVSSALGLLYQWNWDAFMTVMMYTGIVLVLSPAFYAGKEL